jgi:hypothetical protein
MNYHVAVPGGIGGMEHQPNLDHGLRSSNSVEAEKYQNLEGCLENINQ